MVVAVPLPSLVERQQEQVGLFQLAEEAGRALAVGDGIAQVGRQPFKDRRAEQEASERWWLRVQQLCPQVVDDVPVAAGEALDAGVGIGMALERERGEVQARGPAFGAIVQDG